MTSEQTQLVLDCMDRVQEMACYIWRSLGLPASFLDDLVSESLVILCLKVVEYKGEETKENAIQSICRSCFWPIKGKGLEYRKHKGMNITNWNFGGVPNRKPWKLPISILRFLESLLSCLTPKQRRIIELRFRKEPMPYKEIAEEIGSNSLYATQAIHNDVNNSLLKMKRNHNALNRS